MSKETPDSEEQLFDSEAGEVAEDDATDSEVENEESTDEEQEQSLDLEEDQQAPTEKAKDSRMTQLEAFQKKVKAGDIKSAEDLPKAQKWMADYLKFPGSDPKIDLDELKEKVLQEARDERKNELEADSFDELKSHIDAKADPTQKGIINGRFKALRAKGLSRLDALQLSAELAKVDTEGVGEKKRAMRIPTPGSGTSKKTDLKSMSYGEMVGKNVPAEARIAHLESLQ